MIKTILTLKILLCVLLSNVALADATYYLVRHAEKQKDGTDNPHLTEQGHERAELLAQQLKFAGINKIYSSDYHRTLETAEPLAKLLELKVELYNPRELENFAEALKQETGRVLVVGHSNTTPPLAELLSDQAVPEIDDSEYTNLYQIVLVGDKAELTRFQIFPIEFGIDKARHNAQKRNTE